MTSLRSLRVSLTRVSRDKMRKREARLVSSTPARLDAKPTTTKTSFAIYHLTFRANSLPIRRATIALRALSRMAEEQAIVVVKSIEIESVTEVPGTSADDDGRKREPLAPSHDTDIVNAVVTGKRQLTLMDMVGENAKAKQPPAKKQKTDVKSGITAKTPSAAARHTESSLTPLNSIPFSLQKYKDSLTEEERNLLALEYETIGLSW